MSQSRQAYTQFVNWLRHQHSTHLTGVNSSIRRHRNDKFSFLCGATAQLSSKLHPSLSSLLGAGDLSASRPGRITTVERPPVPIPQDSGWAQCRTGRFGEKISCFWRYSNPVPTALPRLPLRDRVYHSPSSFVITDRSFTTLPLGTCLPNDYELHVFQIRYVMEVSGQHCVSGPKTVTNVEENKYLPVRYINFPYCLSVCL